MKLLRHFYGARRNVFLDYDFLHEVDGADELKVRFTRFSESGMDIAETVVPACASWEVQGFDGEELAELRGFLETNMAMILEEAELTRDGDADLVEMDFEIEDRIWTWFAQACYLQGISPEQGLVKTIERFVEEAREKGGLDC